LAMVMIISLPPAHAGFHVSTTKGQGPLSLIQYLHRQLDLSPADRLPKLFDTYPHNPIVPFSRTGAPDNWRELPLWRV
ncbi:hypothetical protein V7G08_10285, partial [Cutibacterium avidum]